MRYETHFLDSSPGLDDIFDTATGRYFDSAQQIIDVLNTLVALEQAYAVASAIMRSNPVGVPPRLVSEWGAVVEKVER